MAIKPSLSFIDLTTIVIGLVIGMGIFRTPVEVANKAGIPSIFFLAWFAGALISFIGALIFAEIGSRYPRAGGFYKIFSHCYHPAFAFMVNWITVISNAASTALVAMLGSEYLVPLLFPSWEGPGAVTGIAFTSVAILFIINLSGIKMSARLLKGLMLVKIVLLILIISSVFFLPGNSEPITYTEPSTFSGSWWSAFSLCFIPVFFTYGGYQQTMNFGDDINHAKKLMPKAILLGILIVMFIYMAVNYAYYHVLGFEGLQHSTTLASDIPGLIFGNSANRIISAVMFLSVMAYVNVSMMSNPRVYYAMAEDKILPKLLMRVNSKTQVQEYALVLFTLFILITFFFAHSFEAMLKYVMFFDSIGFIAAAAAIFIFRKKAKKEKHISGTFQMRGYPLLPIIFILVYASISITIFIHDRHTASIGFILFVLGFPIYHIIQKIMNKKKNSSTHNNQFNEKSISS